MGGADSLILIAEPNNTLMVAIILIVTGIGGAAVLIVMGRRGFATWWIGAAFGMLMAGGLAILAHVPARLVLDRVGIDAMIGPFHERWPWGDVSGLDVWRDRLGLWMSVAPRGADTVNRTTTLFLGPLAVEPGQIERRAKAWQLSAVR